MKKLQILKSVLILFLAVSACKKVEGPLGPRGEQGQMGERGNDGSRIYTGIETPTASVGNIGDFYFNSQTSDFYGPKETSGWGTPSNLRGSAGAPGSKIWQGDVLPTQAVGNIDDFYFNKNTADFYGPKTLAGWGIPINLRGVKGEDGTRILNGHTVPEVLIGRVGDFYFHSTTADFYGPKTEEGWGTPINLRGATGAAGVPGSKIWAGKKAPENSLGVVGDFFFNSITGDFYGPKTVEGWQTPTNLRGTAGTANVIYSKWHESPLPFPIDSGFRINVPQLTASLFQTGQVIVYRKEIDGLTGEEYIEQLSGVTAVPNGYFYRAFVGYIKIGKSYGGIAPFAAPAERQQVFRYVLIPGGIPASAKLNFEDYDQVKAVLRILD